MIRVELYEMARRLAGREVVEVEAATLREALEAVRRACAPLDGPVLTPEGLATHWRASINGRVFEADLDVPLEDGDAVVLVSALAGG